MNTPAAGVPVWHCSLKGAEQLTVGTSFEMDCAGDIPVTWVSPPNLKVVVPEKTAPYSLVILNAKKLEATSAEFVVTSYHTGEMKPEYIRVMDGEVGFEASGMNSKVQSVLKQGEPPKPYGPFGPFNLPMPIWVWIVIALILATISSALWLWFKRIQDRRRLAEDLGKFANAALSPSAQYHKELRALSKKLIHALDTTAIGDWNSTLDQAIRVYLLREFQFLTLGINRGQLLSGLKRRHREAYDLHSGGLEKVFSEMDRFQVHAHSHKAIEFEQILNLARNWCDRLEKDLVKGKVKRL